MLNRRISNYLFYIILVIIAGGIFAVRSAAIGNIDSRIDDLEAENLLLQAQISSIEELVEDNNDVQIDHLYELYNQVPNVLSITDLTYYVTAQLELVGISEDSDMQRSVLVNQGVTFSETTLFSNLQAEFKIVEVQVFFTTQDDSVIEAFIDLLYNADQVFIVRNIEYFTPDGENFIGVSINFLAFYEKEDAS